MRVIQRIEDDTKKVELSISDDRLKLFAKVIPGEQCANATLDQFLANLTEVTPKDLIEMDVVTDVVKELKEGKGCDSRRVARGRSPETGRDGKIVWMVRRFIPDPKAREGREFTDLFTLGLFENVEVGTEIARVYRPSRGDSGMDVQGKELPAKPGQAAGLRWDRSVEVKEDPEHENYASVVAAVAGYVHQEGNIGAVRDTLDLRGNLDWNTGHIDFVGQVRIAGDVQKGFNIKARGDVTVGGNVMGENVISSQGSVSIKGYHIGGEGSSLTTKGDYTTLIANGVTANVGGTIYIGKEARDCTLRAGMLVSAPDAAIVGGTIWCVEGAEIRTLGNQAGLTTVIELRNELEVTKEYRELSQNIAKHETAVAALELHIGPYLKNRGRVPLLKTQFRQKITALLDRYDGVVKSLDRLREQERTMRESKPVQEGVRVSILKQAHAGVVLLSNDARLELKESVPGPVSYRRSETSAEWVEAKNQSSSKR
jgi:uncharacterized protein (DUF342 family)